MRQSGNGVARPVVVFDVLGTLVDQAGSLERQAAAVGMRTAYVPRPDGDPPGPDDSFDLYAADLEDLHAKLLALGERT